MLITANFKLGMIVIEAAPSRRHIRNSNSAHLQSRRTSESAF